MRSGWERTIDTQLRFSGVGYSYETLKIPYTLNGVYNPDFILDNGIILETKGRLLVEDRRKMKAVKEQHPEYDIRFVFQTPETKIQNGKMTNEQWAERNGFQYAVGKVPDEWLKS